VTLDIRFSVMVMNQHRSFLSRLILYGVAVRAACAEPHSLPVDASLRRAHDRVARRFTVFEGVLHCIEYPRDDELDVDPVIVLYMTAQQQASVFSYCETSQLAKASRQAKYGALKPFPPIAACEQISMDVMDTMERGVSEV